jgi:hypothetical protein
MAAGWCHARRRLQFPLRPRRWLDCRLWCCARPRPDRHPARPAIGVLGVLVAVLVAAVAASRALLGVHYSSDVTTGVLLGVACLLAARPLQQLPPPVSHSS